MKSSNPQILKSSSCSKDYKILSSIFFMNLLNYSNRIVPIVPLHFPHGKYFDETLMSIIPFEYQAVM